MQKSIMHRHAKWHLDKGLLSVSIFILGLFAFGFLPVSTIAAGISFGFTGLDDVKTGMAVSVSKSNSDEVELANSVNEEYLLGVVVNEEKSTLVINDNELNEVFVATDGTVELVVSDLGGEIAEGDLVSTSLISGVGKKLNPNTGDKVIGVAKSPFNENSGNSRSVELENNGKVNIGTITVELLIREYSENTGSAEEESFIQYVARRITGKPVSMAQAIISSVLVLIGLMISGSILYGSIRGGFLSIGRNPLSTKMIYQGMVKSSFITLAVMLMTLTVGYVILLI